MSESMLVDYPAITLITRVASCAHTELGPTIGRLYGEIGKANPELTIAGAPRIYYDEWAPDTCTIKAAIPVVDDGPAGEGTDKLTLDAGTALMASYLGPYEGLADAWTALWTDIAAKGLKPGGLFWDEYVTDPGSEPDSSKWQTDIYIEVDIPKI